MTEIANVVSQDLTTRIVQTSSGSVSSQPETAIPGELAKKEPNAALNWNREHHRFSLTRLNQIWRYLDSEEQQVIKALLHRKIGKEEIEQIDEIVKGVEWVRRLEN